MAHLYEVPVFTEAWPFRFIGGNTVKMLDCAKCGPKDAQLFPPKEMKKPEGARRFCRMCIKAINRRNYKGLGRVAARSA
jgi:hypothetical protein